MQSFKILNIAYSHEPKFPYKISSNLTDRKTLITNGLNCSNMTAIIIPVYHEFTAIL